SNPGYNASIKQRVEVKRRWQAKQAEFSLRQDSAKIMLNDTTLTPELQLEFVQLVDSSLAEPDFSEYFPYYGVHWDSTRSAIDLYLTRFPDSKYDDHVSILKRELELPEKED